MTMLGSPSPPSSPSLNRRRRSWARRCERYCCNIVTYFPLAFVYSLTSWAVWVEAGIGLLPVKGVWTGYTSSAVGILLYILLNWSYTTAVFTDPVSPLNTKYGYSHLPSSEPHAYTSFTVKSTGDIRFCKKCQTKKPDRAHHCSTCRRCVLKMDHHCPWLATCVGLRNYKPFLLFLIYTSLFCWICFAVTATWLWSEVLSDGQFQETLMPVNYILLAVLSGIIGLVLTGFTAWHIYLACKGRTTIESLEKTRYLSPLRKSMQQQLNNRNYIDQGRPSISEQLREIHANALPGVTRPEEGEERSSPAQDSLRRSWNDMERQRERDRYSDYLDEQDSERLPNAFDLGWRRNLLHVFGENRWLWFLPICNTIGDGWQWEASPKWLQAREDIAREREAQTRVQKERERAAGWDMGFPVNANSPSTMPGRPRYVEWGNRDGADNRYLMTSNGVATVPNSGRRSPGKADQVLGRSPGSYHDGSLGSPGLPGSATRMHTLDRKQADFSDAHDDANEYDVSSDEEQADRRAFLQRKQSDKPNATANWNDIPEDLLGGSRRGQVARAKSSSRSRETSRSRRKAKDEWQEWGPG